MNGCKFFCPAQIDYVCYHVHFVANAYKDGVWFYHKGNQSVNHAKLTSNAKAAFLTLNRNSIRLIILLGIAGSGWRTLVACGKGRKFESWTPSRELAKTNCTKFTLKEEDSRLSIEAELLFWVGAIVLRNLSPTESQIHTQSYRWMWQNANIAKYDGSVCPKFMWHPLTLT